MIEIREMRMSDELRVRELCATLPEMDMERERPLGFHLKRSTLVAVEDGTVVGHTTWSHHDLFTAWDETVVAASHQGRGIGRQLMEARAARTPGFIIGAAHDENEPMIHLLTSLGFHACQRVGSMMMYTRPHPKERLE